MRRLGNNLETERLWWTRKNIEFLEDEPRNTSIESRANAKLTPLAKASRTHTHVLRQTLEHLIVARNEIEGLRR